MPALIGARQNDLRVSRKAPAPPPATTHTDPMSDPATAGDLRDVHQFVKRALLTAAAAATITPVKDSLIRIRYRGADYELTLSPATPAPGPPPAAGGVLGAVLAHINAARAAAGRNPLALDDNLSTAAAAHTRLMIDQRGLTHQGRGEEKLGVRLAAAGTRWRRCAENVGYQSCDLGDAALIRAANDMTDRMLGETPPDDGHRRNLLDANLARCGLALLRDARGTAWMTQDFTD